MALAVTALFAAAVLAGPSAAAPFAKPAHHDLKGNDPKGKGPAAPAADKATGNAKVKAGAGEGIVQSASSATVVLRALDGSTVSVPVAPSTQVFVDGKRSALGDVRPGFVASAAWKTDKAAAVLEAFALSGPHAVSVGVVASVSTDALVVTGTGGNTVSIRINAKTRVSIDGKPATLAAVKTGYTVVVGAKDSKGKKPAHELRFLRPR